jgi:hypothetical protein
MTRLFFTTATILAFCLTAFAQTKDISCPQIKIKAPEFINDREEKFKVSASFESEKTLSESKFNWIVIKDDRLEKKSDEGIFEIETNNTNKHNRITIIAENPDTRCKNPAVANVLLIPNIGSPWILDEYTKLNWNDERARLEMISLEMKKREDSELFIWVDFDKSSFNPKSKIKLSKILNYLSSRGLQKKRVTFMISEADSIRYKYQPIPNEFLNSYYPDEYILIRGEDLEKVSNLF